MRLWILGCRGVPAQHGGFETFAEHFAQYMSAKGHDVTVACQVNLGEAEGEDTWRGIRRLKFAERPSPKGTIRFDLRSAWAASQQKDAVVLTLGYNTAVFSLLHRFRGVRHFMNMDGVEWRRQKWSTSQRIWLRANEWLGARLADRLIADHPLIKEHLSQLASTDKITVIPYGADALLDVPLEPVQNLGLQARAYDLVIARPEPENSILEIVEAHARSPRRFPLVVLGNFYPEKNVYHRLVLGAAQQSDIRFVGAIYDASVVNSLRFHTRAYVHGHTVGGTNPSLVEALAAGNAVICHRNGYNSWVAGDSARLFSTPKELQSIFDEFDETPALLDEARAASRKRHECCFRNEMIMSAYENLLGDSPLPVEEWSYAPLSAMGSCQSEGHI